MQDLQFQICGDYSGRWEPGTPSVPSQLADGEHFFLARWRAGDAELGWFGIYHPALADIKEELPKLAAKISRDASSPARWDNLKYLSHHIPGWGLYYAHPDYLRLWRDPFGILPIVLSFQDQGVQWATRPKFLPSPPTKIRQSRVTAFLMARNDPSRDDFWQGVYRLRAGETLLFRRNRRQIYQTWWPGPVKELDEAENLEEPLKEILQASIKRAMARGVNAVSLSGGVDSTLLLAMMVENGEKPKAFSMIAPDAPHFHEQHIIEVTAQSLRVDVDYFDIGQPLEWSNPEIHHPFPDFGPAAMAEAAYVVPFLRVLKEESIGSGSPAAFITGQGADHLFSCARNEYLHYKVFEDRNWRELTQYRSRRLLLSHILRNLRLPVITRDPHHSTIAPWLKSPLDQRLRFKMLEHDMSTKQQRQKALQFQNWGWEEICRMEERYRRATNVLPFNIFLDPKIAEFALSIPPSLLRTAQHDKYLLRKLLKDYVPDNVALRPKYGFFDEVLWRGLEEDLVPPLEELLTDEALAMAEIKDSASLHEEIAEYRQSGQYLGRPYSREIWALLSTLLWKEAVRI